MLQLILGRAGYGKTQYIREKIKHKVALGQRVILIVPEQFSFESERALYFDLGAKSSMQVEVLSFSRLAHNIFREYGGTARQYVSDGGKSVLLHMAFNELTDQLSVYKHNTTSPGFIKRMTDAVSELKQAGITPTNLKDIAIKQSDSPLKNKTLELSTILDSYNAMLSRGYADSDDDLKIALELLRQHNFFADTCIFIDEFKGFTAVEIEILGNCVTNAKEVWAALCIDAVDDKKDDDSIFYGTNYVANSLKIKARENNIPINSIIKLETPYRYKNKSLVHLEKNLFSLDKTVQAMECEDISIFTAKDYYQEIEYIASQIKNLIRENNLKYRDIAIIGRNIDQYKNPIQTIMKRYDIPIFFGVKQGIINKPLPSFILSVLKAAVKNYDNDFIFAALKTGLTPIPTENISLTENYVFTWDIKGKMWESEFVQNPQGFVSEFNPDDTEQLEIVNSVREYIIGAIQKIKSQIKNCTGDHFVKSVYDCLESLEIPQRYTQIVESIQDHNESQGYIRIWELICDTLEEMGHILKNTNLTMQKFTELFELMLENLDMGDIPQTLDQVLVGDASLVRPNSPVAVFVIGVNEGVFPMIPEPSGIFSDSERKQLIELGLKLADSIDKKILDERFISYKTLTSPSHKLYITYSTNDLKGTPLYRSSIIDEIKKILPNIKEYIYSNISPEFYAQNYHSAYYTLAKNYRIDSSYRATLMDFFSKNDYYKSNLNKLEKAAKIPVFEIKDTSLSHKLFGKSMRLSPSRVERYWNCSFAYFIEYGLKVKKRKKAELNPLEIGSLIHYALQILLQKYGGKQLVSLTQEQIKQEIALILEEYIGKYMGGTKDKTKRFKYLYTRLSTTLCKLISQLAIEFSQSDFDPVDFELKVGYDGEIKPVDLMLPTGGHVRVEGVIDRVDIMEKGNQKYIRIIDYKTGSKEFKLSDVYYGINMQMLIYLFSVWQNGYSRYGSVMPAGILYMPAKTSPINSDRSTTKEELEKLSIKSFRMHGLLLDDPDIVKGMDKSAKGVFVNVSLDKQGKLKKSDAIASLAQLGKLKSYTEKLIVQMAEQLHNGYIEANPNIDGQFKACDYCSYQSICGHEQTDDFNAIESLDKDTFFDIIGGDKDGDKLD